MDEFFLKQYPRLLSTNNEILNVCDTIVASSLENLESVGDSMHKNKNTRQDDHKLVDVTWRYHAVKLTENTSQNLNLERE